MPLIDISNVITFAPNVGVLVHPEALELDPEKLQELVALAHHHNQDQPLIEACCGGQGPLADIGRVSFEEYLEYLKKAEIAEATTSAKKSHTAIRRRQYSAAQPQLVLALIESGTPYVCAHEGCEVTKALTIDHIIPLSRGGTDDLENLQFMCKPHNSSKGDRIDT